MLPVFLMEACLTSDTSNSALFLCIFQVYGKYRETYNNKTKYGDSYQKLFFVNPEKAQVFSKKFCMNDKIAFQANNSVE